MTTTTNKTTPKPLIRTISRELHWVDESGEIHAGKCSGLRGDCSNLRGDCSNLRGDCSGLWGDCSGLWGDCSNLRGNCSNIPNEFRPCSLADWVKKQ